MTQQLFFIGFKMNNLLTLYSVCLGDGNAKSIHCFTFSSFGKGQALRSSETGIIAGAAAIMGALFAIFNLSGATLSSGD